MEAKNTSKYSLNIPLSPSSPEFTNFSLLSETESDRLGSSITTVQISELKAQLDILNEDRQRLKKENEKLRQEKNTHITKTLAAQADLQRLDSERILVLQQEVTRLRKECEEKDMLLNTMRTLLGGHNDLSRVLKENKEVKSKITASPVNSKIYQSRLPKKSFKQNRSISPITKCV